MVLHQDLLEEFQCTICTEYMFPPIIECGRGHAICGTCSAKLKFCPECKDGLIYRRNFALEALHGKLSFPCKHSDKGCHFYAKPNKLKEHEKSCTYSETNETMKKKIPQSFYILCLVAIFILSELYLFITQEDNLINKILPYIAV